MTPVEEAANLIVNCLRRSANVGAKVLVCGNGGSAAQADHFVAELVGRFETESPAWPAYNLAASPATLTAIANDYGYEHVFSRQVEAYGRRGDVLVCLSTSGRSENVVRAAETALGTGMRVIAIGGQLPCRGRRLDDMHWEPLDVDVWVARSVGGWFWEKSTAYQQEWAMTVLHEIARLVEQRMTQEEAA